MSDRFPHGVRVAAGDISPTATEMNALLEERDTLVARVADLTAASTPVRWTAPAPAAITRRAWRAALTSLGINPDACAALEVRDGHLRVELWRNDRLTDIVHVPFTTDPTPESVPMVPVVPLPPAPPTQPFDWTGVHRAWPEPATDPGERR